MSDQFPFSSPSHPRKSLKQQALAGLNRIAERAGISLVIRRRPTWNSFPQETVAPTATYAPWKADKDFQEIHHHAADVTMVDVYRCYELWQLLGEVVDIEGAILEVGSWRGGTGAILARRAQLLGISAPVYVCDTFCGLVKVGAYDGDYIDGMYNDCTSENVRSLYEKLGLNNAQVLEGIFPDETGGKVNSPHIRLCHIDVDIHDAARDIVDWVWPRTSVGGVLVFDDYAQKGPVGITRFVESMRGRSDRIVIHNLNGHGIVVKLK